jgi:hypothetical protein
MLVADTDAGLGAASPTLDAGNGLEKRIKSTPLQPPYGAGLRMEAQPRDCQPAPGGGRDIEPSLG